MLLKTERRERERAEKFTAYRKKELKKFSSSSSLIKLLLFFTNGNGEGRDKYENLSASLKSSLYLYLRDFLKNFANNSGS